MLKRWIEKTGKEDEFRLFLKMFQGLPKHRFAVIKVSGRTLENQLDRLAADIALLNQLEVYPIVVHGAGSTLDQRLTNTNKVDGLRVTGAAELQVIQEVYERLNAQLCRKIIEHGGNAVEVPGTLQCELRDEQRYGQVGRVIGVDLEPVKEALLASTTPVISPLGQLSNGRLCNVNADTVAQELVKVLVPMKFILLTETGGILDRAGKVIPFFNLPTDLEGADLSGGMLLKVKELEGFLAQTSAHQSAVVITSADNLLKELFTVVGGGTFLKAHRICSTEDPAGVLDHRRVTALLEHAFDKKLVQGYFDSGLSSAIYQVDLEGIAIIKELGGLPYLDKFAVGKPYQGTGLGKTLWAEVMRHHTSLIWRATQTNPFHGFYTRYCDGMVKENGWTIYWKALPLERVISSLPLVAGLEPTLICPSSKER